MPDAPERDRCLRDIADRLDRLQEDLTELRAAWQHHLREYGDMLKSHKTTAEERAKLRSAVVEKSVTGAVWAVIVFVAIAAWSYFRDQVR